MYDYQGELRGWRNRIYVLWLKVSLKEHFAGDINSINLPELIHFLKATIQILRILDCVTCNSNIFIPLYSNFA